MDLIQAGCNACQNAQHLMLQLCRTAVRGELQHHGLLRTALRVRAVSAEGELLCAVISAKSRDTRTTEELNLKHSILFSHTCPQLDLITKFRQSESDI